MISQAAIERRLAHGPRPTGGGSSPLRKTGEDIFGEGPYPRTMEEFIGQEQARLHLFTAMTSALKRKAPVDHVLLASGHPGIGKTSLAKLVAAEMNVGIIELSGQVDINDAQAAVSQLQEGDVLFLDEVHQMVTRGKAKAEWLLHLLQDGKLLTPRGEVPVPPITVVAATTDAQKLPQTILGRFPVRPMLVPYTADEAVWIARGAGARLGFGNEELPWGEKETWLNQLVVAADFNPRQITMLLMAVRDIGLATNLANLDEQHGYNIAQALQWNGLTTDGLDRIAQDYLVALWTMDGTAGLVTLKAALNESELLQTERTLIQRGYINITSKGRELSDMGTERAKELAEGMVA